MAESSIGGSGPMIRVAGGVSRAGSATDRQKRRQEQEHPEHPGHERAGGRSDERQKDGSAGQPDEQRDRRARDAANQQRRRLLDLLFEEIDGVPGLETAQRERLRRNLRARLTPRPAPAADAVAQGPPLPPERPDAGSAILSPLPEDETERIVALAAPKLDQPADEAAANAILAAQLRDCLARHSNAARKVAFYLRLLLSLDGAFRPHLVLDI